MTFQLHQEVRVQLSLTMWLPVTLDEESIGVLVRDGIQKGFEEEISKILPDRYLDILAIHEEAEMYATKEISDATR